MTFSCGGRVRGRGHHERRPSRLGDRHNQVDNFMLAGSPSPSPSWRGSDSIRVLLFSLTLRGGQAVLRYYPRLLSSWPTSSTDAPRLWSIPEDVESSFPLRLSPSLTESIRLPSLKATK